MDVGAGTPAGPVGWGPERGAAPVGPLVPTARSRAAGTLAYVYAGVALLAAVGLVVVAAQLWREANRPCTGDGTCESFAMIGVFFTLFFAAAAVAAAIVVALLGQGLRRGSRVAKWTTLVLGGLVAVLGGLAGLAAMAGSNPSLGVPLLVAAALAAVPATIVALDVMDGRSPVARRDPATATGRR